MRPLKHPISHALTSFNGAAVEPVPPPATKTSGKVHHLPASIWKKREGEAKSPLDLAIERSRDFFFREQLPAGYWWAELESNVTITAEYLMLFHLLGNVDPERERKIVTYLRAQPVPADVPTERWQ